MNRFVLPKKVSESEKKQILMDFKKGLSKAELSLKYKFSVQTITRYLKNNLDESLFSKINNKGVKKLKNSVKIKERNSTDSKNIEKDNHSFFEIIPLSENIEFEKQKEISSIPLIDVNFPEVVFLLIDKKIELEIKLLKDYAEWQFCQRKIYIEKL